MTRFLRKGRFAALASVGVVGSACLGLASAISPAFAVSGSAGTPASSGPWYTVALGASLAAGTGASTLANDYVNLVTSYEATRFPGLTVDNVSCGGDTTAEVLDGDHCRPAGETQLGDAESFLQQNAGHVAYITVDIGADEVLPCITNGAIDIGCVLSALVEIQTDLPIVLQGLQSAAPGVPIVGALYYNPDLYTWITGTAGQSLARTSATALPALNSTLSKVYATAGVPVANWSAAFASQDFSDQSTWDGQALPLNVARTCNWTHECDSGKVGQNVHTNDTGYQVLATSIENVLDRIWRGSDSGMWAVQSGGTAVAVGNATSLAPASAESEAGSPVAPVVGIASTPDGGGYWLVTSGGGVFTFGDAGYYGSMGGTHLVEPVVGIAASPSGFGYWLVASDGGVFTFGDAGYYGSMGGTHLVEPVVGIAASPSGFGYWLVASDGGVFTFGDAGYYGSMGGTHLVEPVVGIAASPSGFGYWLVASDGGVFTFGDAEFAGSSGGSLSSGTGVVGIVPTLSGGGYELVTASQGLIAFGDAQISGSYSTNPLSSPVVGAALD